MSTLLEGALDPARVADCIANDKILAVDCGPVAAAAGESFEVAIAALEEGTGRVEVCRVEGLAGLRQAGAL